MVHSDQTDSEPDRLPFHEIVNVPFAVVVANALVLKSMTMPITRTPSTAMNKKYALFLCI